MLAACMLLMRQLCTPWDGLGGTLSVHSSCRLCGQGAGALPGRLTVCMQAGTCGDAQRSAESCCCGSSVALVHPAQGSQVCSRDAKLIWRAVLGGLPAAQGTV